MDPNERDFVQPRDDIIYFNFAGFGPERSGIALFRGEMDWEPEDYLKVDLSLEREMFS